MRRRVSVRESGDEAGLPLHRPGVGGRGRGDGDPEDWIWFLMM